MFKLSVSQAKGVVVEVPEKMMEASRKTRECQQVAAAQAAATPVRRILKIQEFAIGKVVLAGETSISANTLSIDNELAKKALSVNPLVKKITMDVIEPHQRHIWTNSVMDIMPIVTKVTGEMGEGVTNWISGVTVLLTGTDEAGKQVAEFGSSHGMLDEKIKFGMPGTPDGKDIILRIDVVIEAGTGMERRGPYAAHQVCDCILDEVRRKLVELPSYQAVRIDTFQDVRRPGQPKILIVKEVGGQGAMHEKLLLPAEPCGVRGARSIVDLGNVPVLFSPNELKDGAIHSMT